MRKFIFLIPALWLLTGCPKNEEIKQMTEELKAKKAEAIKVIESKDFGLENLMKVQDYFFDFSEKVHLMIVDEQSQKGIQSMIKKSGAKETCETFILPMSLWEQLEIFCSNGAFYKCSPEIKNYRSTVAKFAELAGKDLETAVKSEPACN